MRSATLITWLLTVSLGGYMLRTWIASGGPRSERARPDGLPPPLIFGHAALAVTGVVIWGAFLASGVKALAWAAIVCMTVAVGLGLSTVTLWTPYPARPARKREDAESGRPVRDEGFAVRDPAGTGTAEWRVTDEMIAQLLAEPHRPRRPGRGAPDLAVLVPIAHGFLAITTFVLAVMTASTPLRDDDRPPSLAKVRPHCRYWPDGRPKRARRRT